MRISTLISRGFFLTGIGVCTFLAADFFKFADASIEKQSQKSIPTADGIASLTGGSKARLATGVALLENGHGKRLLITGVYKKTTIDELYKLAGGARSTYDCCIDIGKQATDTIGNGREIADWAQKHKFKKIIIVTDNYHMQRSLLEIKNSAPSLELISYKVAASPYIAREWWKSPDAVKGLSLEYYKYLGAQMRIKFGFNPKKSRQK